MKVSVIGTGRMGKGLVKTLSPHLPLLWGSRSVEKTRKLIIENHFNNVEPVNHEGALEADIIFHSLWFRDVIPWAEKNAKKLTGKILVDIVNPFTDDFSDFTLGWGESASEVLQNTIPETAVVGAFKNTFFKVFDEPIQDGLKSDCYVTSNDEFAKQTVRELLAPLPFRILDAGRLENNRTIERMTLFERELAIRHGHYPYVSFRLFGLNQ